MEALKEISLAGTWELREESLSCPPQEHGRIAALAEGWIPTPVPGDVRQGLIAAGRMKEPLEGLNSFEGHWVEDRSWWFRKRFKVPPAMRKAQAAELVLDGLDANASIFLNGAHLGDHPSAFRPFVARVERHLRAGENVLLVRLTHGVEDVTAEQVEELGGYIPTPSEASRGGPSSASRSTPGAGTGRRGRPRWPSPASRGCACSTRRSSATSASGPCRAAGM